MTAQKQGEDGRLWDTPFRKKFAKRAAEQVAIIGGHQPRTLSATPLKDRCNRQRKRYSRRAGIQKAPSPQSDCRGCGREKSCEYGNDLNKCPERSLVLRCKKCGQLTRFRVIVGVVWELCPVCRP